MDIDFVLQCPVFPSTLLHLYSNPLGRLYGGKRVRDSTSVTCRHSVRRDPVEDGEGQDGGVVTHLLNVTLHLCLGAQTYNIYFDK